MATIEDFPPGWGPHIGGRFRDWLARRRGTGSIVTSPTTKPTDEITTESTSVEEMQAPPASLATYLAPDERILSITRRHLIALAPTTALWLLLFMVGLAVSVSYVPAHQRFELSYLGAAFIVFISVWAASEFWHWRMERFVLTNQRVLFIQGIVARQVNGLPLRSVLDTTYRQTIAGRLFGYADISLNLSGQPGLRNLTRLSHPEYLYHQLLDRLKLAAV